jgi:maltose O-acetyltransferase
MTHETSAEKEAMLRGEPYRASDSLLAAERLQARRLLHAYNQSAPDAQNERRALLARLLGAGAETAFIEPNFRCDYGYNIRLGRNFYANFDCIMLDVLPIDIGHDVMFAPGVQLLTAAHPLDPQERSAGLEFGKPIRIGDRVWLGAGVLVCPGVTIGEGVTVGAGSVVTRDLPARVVAAGNPCRVLREL